MGRVALVTGLAAAVLVSVALVPGPGQRLTFRTRLDLVNLGVTVLDRRDKLVTGLEAADFNVFEDGKKQEIAYFAAGDSAGDENSTAADLHLGIMLDVSGSMDEDLQTARTAAIRFLNTLPNAKDYTVVDFDTEVRVAQFGPSDFPRLVERVRSRKAEGYTALYDAIGVYLDTTSSQQGRNVLVLYSDGGDNSSHMRFAELLDLLKAVDVTVYTIGFLEHAGGGRLELRTQLQRMAEATGGYFINPTSMKDIEAAYEKVRDEIAAQYTIGFVSTNTKMDGTWRKVEVRVVKPEMKGVKIRSRKGYYAPYRSDDKPPVRREPAD